ncbi:MAG: NAD(P)-dependent oxidoreductase [Candidatus Omnitrophica bacterium]|nr:NAD(P)-dependent oxidoreductase [Candidatus Omnitrophota bacterium]
MKKILVTGATGFIGRHCLPLLIEKGYQVHAVSFSKNDFSCPGVRWCQVNLLNSKDTDSLVSSVRATHLLHLAWYTEHKKYWTALENHDWVRASFDLVKSFRTQGGQRAVIAGTCAEYDWSQGRCSEDTTPLLPATLYGNCRNELRKKVEVLSKETGLSSVWARIFFAYGPAEHPNRLVSSVIASLLKGKQIPCSEGNQKRDFLYVEDVALAFVALLESNFCGAINIGSGVPVSIKELINIISAKLGRSDLVQFGKITANTNEPELLVADVKKIQDIIGWFARYDLNHGLDKTIAWWKDYLKKENSN